MSLVTRNMVVSVLRSRLVWGLVSLALLGSVFHFVAGSGTSEDSSDSEAHAAEGEARIVQTTPVTEELAEETLLVTGEFHAYEEAQLSFKIPGYVHVLYLQPGDAVEAGQPLGELDDTDFVLGVRRAEAELQQARARLGLASGDTREPNPHATSAVTRARAELEEAERRVGRIRALRKRESASQSELDAAETAYLVARHTHAEAVEAALERVATLTVREAELEQARQNLTYTVLEAPFDGFVQEKLTGPGAYLEEGDPVYALVRTDILRLRVEVPERDIHRVSVGQTVRFRSTDGGEMHTAELTRLLPQLEADTRVLIGEADIDNPVMWRPGLFVRAELVVAGQVPRLTVPTSAITSFVGIHRVFLVEDGVARAREVELGRRIGDRTAVLEGVSPGAEVIVEPGGIRSGDPVQVASEE